MLESPSRNPTIRAFSALAVIVLYKMTAAQSPAFTSLMTAKAALSRGQKLQVYLFDNSPEDAEPTSIPEGVLYEKSEQNVGLAAAYNRALKIADAEGHRWLLTLDQDTILGPDFLSQIGEQAVELEGDHLIAAIVPRLSDSGIAISPFRVKNFGDEYLSYPFTGFLDGETGALNSGALIRVSALEQIGGYDPYFWLDYVDSCVFRKFHLNGKRIFVAGNIQIEHELSLLHRKGLKPERFRNFLQAESAFCDLYRGCIKGLLLTARLLARIWRQRRRNDDIVFRRLTFEQFKKRLLNSRSDRIRAWRKEVEDKFLSPSSPPDRSGGAHHRPKVSVCMAVHNGSNFIEQQIASILPQLADQDEFIIVDDASSDDTMSIIESFGDNRIRIVRQFENCGVVRTFGRALAEARGDVILLTDHDDIWREDKVTKFLQVFGARPDVTVAMSDLLIIDGEGKIKSGPKFASQQFHEGVLFNIARNRYQGSAMAFRRSILKYCLPFPPDVPIHDVWIGLVNQLIGRTYFIEEPLLYYRRHGKNDSRETHAPLMQMVRWRWALIKNLTLLYLRRLIFRRHR
jgi:GT2 family glycosyltransferase